MIVDAGSLFKIAGKLRDAQWQVKGATAKYTISCQVAARSFARKRRASGWVLLGLQLLDDGGTSRA